MGRYFVMRGNRVREPTTLGESPALPGGPWMRGARLTTPVAEPLRYALDPGYPGEMLAFYTNAAPLMRDDLLAALESAGAGNLQTFAAELRDPASGRVFTNYRAVNIIGLLGDTISPELVNGLAIDEAAAGAGGLLIFRPAISVNAVVVHEKVKAEIEARKIIGMKFIPPENWSG